MKLLQKLGINLRAYFLFILFFCPFIDFFLCVFLYLGGISAKICIGLFWFIFICIWIHIESIKCPNCGTKLISTYRVMSKYYKGVYHTVPKNCPCCGLDLDEVSKNEGTDVTK